MWIALLIVVLILLAFLFAIAPNPKRRSKPVIAQTLFAHRGLHGGSAPENSLAAFRRAVERGYGIELDVQLTADDEIVVFHDMQLNRMCGAEGLIPQMTLEQLRGYRLLDTEEGIPTLDAVLSLVDGRVPLLIEIKLSPQLKRLTQRVAQKVESYHGEYLYESFAPQCLNTLRRVAPNALRGQLVARFSIRNHTLPVVIGFALSNLLLNFLSRPDFIAYQQTMDRSLILGVMRKIYRVPLAVWTIRSQAELDALKARADRFIFEEFDPE